MTLEEKAIEAFEGRVWAMGIVLAEKTDMKNAEIQFYMGFCREHGYAIEKDYGEAVDWYKKAAEQGHAKAMRNLGKMYDDGVWAHRNVVEAVKWYVEAAVKGDKVAKTSLGKLAADEDTAPFVSLYAKTAFENEEWKRGVVAALSTDMSNRDLQSWLAYCYIEGKGVEKDEDEAFKWCRKAAEGGNFWSMNKLGLMYEFGDGTEKNLEKAFRWYKAAAENGHAGGQYNLGDMYEFGKGTEQDLAAAFKWYKASAEKGNSVGQYHLGDMYEHGKGTAKNAKLAVEWYTKAAKKGNNDAQKALERIEAETAAAKNDPIKALNDMIGLQSVKDQVKKLVDSARMQKMREAHGFPKDDMSYHCVFTGNPGTGKTTVARLYAKILYKLGIVKKDNFVEADRSKLIDSHYGETEKKTANLVESALDGVLFIDEAYTLYKENDERDSGREAIDTLLKMMEDNRDRLVVIVAGYTKKMEAFLGANEGMRSRFPNRIHFPDYSAGELVEIFKFYARRKKYIPDDDAFAAVREEVEFELAKRAEGFGNARFIREDILARAVQSMSQRIAKIENPSREDLQRIVADDIPDNSGRSGLAETVDDVLEELDKLVGLRPVKEYIRNLANSIQIQKRRKEEGLPTDSVASYHCVFTGSPGTGKTTVARYMARIYRALGIIRTSNLVEADRSKLVGKYIGHTEEKTNKVIDAALNGVLFIDEAYSLYKEDDERDFGHEAVSTLLKRMEDDRDRLVVIVAGYADEMRKFIGMNPGLQSRFSRYVNFPDYSADELVEIFARLASKEKYSLGEGVLDAVRKIMGKLVAKKTKSFGNARDVEKLFNGVCGRQSSRLVKEGNPTKGQLSAILLEDVCDVPAAGSEEAEAPQDAAHSEDAAHRKMEDGGVVVAVDYSPCLNLAMALNNAQFVFRVQIHNGTGLPLSGSELSIASPDGAFDEWHAEIGDLTSGEVADLCRMSMKLNAGLLEKVSCARSGSLRLTLRAGGKTVFSQSCDVSIVPANYLHSVMLAPALLAAHVLPTSAVVRQVQSDAMRILDAETGIASIAGYANGEGSVGDVCEAVFRAVRDIGIRFATAPASLGLPRQKVRTPAEITRYKLGNCLDLTLLFAAIFEECRLNAVIVLMAGHAFLGVFRSDRHFAHAVMPDLGVLKKACKEGQMIFIEATRACGATNTFHAAFQSAASKLMSLAEEEFHCAIDVGMARRDGILPLPIDDMESPSAVSTAASPASAVSCGGEGVTLTEARIAPMSKPCMVKFYDERTSVRTWKDVFEAILRKMNERDPSKFEALPCDPQFGRYFMRIEPGRRTPHDYFKLKLGTGLDVRAKAITGRAYLWRTDYYFRKLMDHLGVDVGRVEVVGSC